MKLPIIITTASLASGALAFNVNCYSGGESVDKGTIKAKFPSWCKNLMGYAAVPAGGKVNAPVIPNQWGPDQSPAVVDMMLENDYSGTWLPSEQECIDSLTSLTDSCSRKYNTMALGIPATDNSFTVGGWVEVVEDRWIKMDPNQGHAK